MSTSYSFTLAWAVSQITSANDIHHNYKKIYEAISQARYTTQSCSYFKCLSVLQKSVITRKRQRRFKVTLNTTVSCKVKQVL